MLEGCEPGQPLTVGQYQDWIQFDRQFNLAFDKTDVFWALHIADFRNANKGDDAVEFRPIDVLPWVDPYADDEGFFSALRGFAAEVQATE